jgi:hypothetical protein
MLSPTASVVRDAGGCRVRPAGAERVRSVPAASGGATRVAERASQADSVGGAALWQRLPRASLEGRRRCKFKITDTASLLYTVRIML